MSEVARPSRPGFGYARRHGVALTGWRDDHAEIACRDGVRVGGAGRTAPPSRRAAAASRRCAGNEFERLLRDLYEQGDDARAMVVGSRRAHRSEDARRRVARARGPARKRGRRADHPPDQRAAHRSGQGRRLRHPHRAVREPPRRALPHRRRAARSAERRRRRSRTRWSAASRSWPGSTSPRSACRRTAASACASPDGRSTCASRRFRPDAASASCCACSTSRPASSTSRSSAWTTTTRARLEDLIARPHGILLVTGPTGSGKTTTLYGALLKLNDSVAQHHDGRGSDRVLHRRRRPDAGQHARRHDLRARPARDPAPGSGRRHGRRDPRPRDRRDRRAGVADRPSRAVDAAHERRGRRGHAPARHGRRAVPARVDADRRARAAAGARARSGDARSVCVRRPSELAAFGKPADTRRRCIARAPISQVGTPATRAAPASTSSSRSTRRCAA